MLLYFLIGALTASLSVAWGPHDWRFWSAVALAGLVAIKAMLHDPNGKPKPTITGITLDVKP
jgi:hypothetical protein